MIDKNYDNAINFFSKGDELYKAAINLGVYSDEQVSEYVTTADICFAQSIFYTNKFNEEEFVARYIYVGPVSSVKHPQSAYLRTEKGLFILDKTDADICYELATNPEIKEFLNVKSAIDEVVKNVEKTAINKRANMEIEQPKPKMQIM